MEAVGRVVVIGIGHRDRGDDAIGPAVVDEIGVRSRAVRTVVREGDLADLCTVWGPDDTVVIVDSLPGTEPAGVLRTVATERLVADPGTSTHGIGVGFALELARLLGRHPRRLVVLAVTTTSVETGPMSADLRAAVPALAAEVLALALDASSGRDDL